jgi:outer membrane protein assembly factor BamD (BamD/ComL family)
MDADGKERWRIEGYLPKNEFAAQLELGLARVDVMNKNWAAAERRYMDVVNRYPNTKAAAEATYWQAVSHYKATNDHNALSEVAETFTKKYQDSVPAMKSVPWRH